MTILNRLSGYSSIRKVGRKTGRGQEGSILVFLIVLMVIFTALGVGMVSLFGTSIMSAFSPNSARRANYMAESGLRYTISEIRNTAPTAREAMLTNNIDDGTVAGKWFNVFPGLARYQVRVYPYWSKTAAGTGAATSVINATVPNSGFPLDLTAIPGVGGVARLHVGPNNLVGINSVTGGTGGSKTVTYNLASAVTIPAATTAYANLAYPTLNAVAVTKGSAATPLVLNINDRSALPQKNGVFMAIASGSPIDGKVFAYQTARVTGGNVRLENIDWSYANASFNFPAGSYLVFAPVAGLAATGEIGGGLSQTQKNLQDAISLYSAGSPLPPSGPNQTPQALTPDMSGFNNLNAIDTSRSGDRVVVAGYIATGGTHAYWAAFQHLGEAGYRFPDPEQPTRDIGYHVAPISNAISDNLRNSWMQHLTLNYDVQIKNGWDLNHPEAVSGLVFRWQQSPLVAENTANYQDTYEGYGICFMQYNRTTATSNDRIPNSVKPPGENKRLLLVLWQQKVNASGVPVKIWLAYAELGYPTNYWNPAWGERVPADKDQKVTGYQVWPDGALNDNATVIVRVEDKFETVAGVTTRYNDIKVFYGDAAEYNFTNDSRSKTAVATNKQRARYYPKWLEVGNPGQTLPVINPRWPSNQLRPTTGTIANWFNDLPWYDPDPTSYDYFSLTSSAPTAPYNTVTWVTNPAVVSLAGVPPVMLLADGCTIRTTDFTIDSFPSGRKEIGLFAMGDMNSSNRTIAFDDFYIQILGGY